MPLPKGRNTEIQSPDLDIAQAEKRQRPPRLDHLHRMEIDVDSDGNLCADIEEYRGDTQREMTERPYASRQPLLARRPRMGHVGQRKTRRNKRKKCYCAGYHQKRDKQLPGPHGLEGHACEYHSGHEKGR